MKRILSLILCFLILSSCAKRIYTPVESVVKNDVHEKEVNRDSVYIHDSIYIVEKGDIIKEFTTRYKYKETSRVDTLYISRQDSIQVPFPVEIVRHKTPTIMWWVIAVLAILATPGVIRFLKKLKGLRFFDLY